MIYESVDPGFVDYVLQYEYVAVWIVMVFVMLIVYTNFLIASVSDTYEKVTDMQDSAFSKIQLKFLAE